MAKLNNKEIQDRIDLETGRPESEFPVKLPRDAHSKFYFEIEESIEDLIRDMKERPKKHYPQERVINEETGEVRFWDGGSKAPWKFIEIEDGKYELEDTDWCGCYASVRKEDEKLSITTATSSYQYEITPRAGGGSCVEFSGPVNGLLAQNLLPKMTYEPYTLWGKFVDKETGKDLTDYMDMQLYGELRAQKNRQIIEGSYLYGYTKPGNEQDRYGFQVNERFNNEIPFFAKSIDLEYTLQERKQYRAQKGFEEGRKAPSFELKENKADIKKRLEAVRGKLSGVVAADKIAEDKISGKDKRMATPQISVELAAEIRRRKATEK